jgi:hypothetical protein
VVTGDCRTDPWRQSPGRRLRICSLTAAQRDGERSDEPVGHSRCKHRPARGRHLDRRDELARGRLAAVRVRHVHVHESDVGSSPVGKAQGVFGVGRLADRGDAVIAIEEGA